MKTAIDCLADHLAEVGSALGETAEMMRATGDVSIAEPDIHTLAQCLTLLETAALCVEAGNTDHAERILEYATEHRFRASRSGLSSLPASSPVSGFTGADPGFSLVVDQPLSVASA